MIKAVHNGKPSPLRIDVRLDSYCALIDAKKLLIDFGPQATFDNALQHFSGEIIRDPENLRLHIQRVFLILRQVAPDKIELASALADLFIVLKLNGAELKARVLGLAKKHLPEDCWTYLKKNENLGLTSKTAIMQKSKLFSKSLLSDGLLGDSDIISKENNKTTIDSYALYEQALMSLEYGQINLALSLLEEAHNKEPSNEEIIRDLLVVYKGLDMESKHGALLKKLQKGTS